MMIATKKGEGVSWPVIGLILIILGAIVVIFIVWLFASGGTDNALDNLCMWSSGARHRLTVTTLDKPFPDMCEPRPAVIDADNSKTCPYITKREGQPISQLCAAEGLMEQIRRCWLMRGRGDLNPGDFECFYIRIQSSSPVSLNRQSLLNAMDYPYQEKQAGEIIYYKSVLPSTDHLIIKTSSGDIALSTATLADVSVSWTLNKNQDYTICFYDDYAVGADKIIIKEGIGDCPWSVT